MSDSTTTARIDRRQEILMALAEMLEGAPDTRITTAGLASRVGVSEAALYRHFPSKSKMYAGLLAFAEDTLFGLVGRIPSEQVGALTQCQGLLRLYLEFCDFIIRLIRYTSGWRRSSNSICVRPSSARVSGPACRSLPRPIYSCPQQKAGCLNFVAATSDGCRQMAGQISGHSSSKD